MQGLRRIRTFWIGLLLLGISAWGNLHPPYIMPSTLALSVVVAGLAVWFSFRKASAEHGTPVVARLASLTLFGAASFFLGLIILTPVLDPAVKYSIDVGGVSRTFRVRVPPTYDQAQPAPLLLVFHGYNQTGYTIERLSRLDGVGEKNGLFVVYPDGHQRRWRTRLQTQPVNDVEFVYRMIEAIRNDYVIDSTKIFAAGFSNGGSMVLSLACAMHETVAAVVAIGARLGDHHITRCQERSVDRVPAMFINGTEDRFVDWEGTRLSARRWADLLHCGLNPTVDTLPDLTNDGTRVWRERYDGCPAPLEVVLYAVDGAGHTWPNGGYQPSFYLGRTTRDFDSGAAITQFLQRATERDQAD